MRHTTDMSDDNLKTDEPRVLLAHGGGGRLARELVRECFLSALGDAELARLTDAAVAELPPGRLAFTTDAFVVKPLFFRGGDIGRLAVCGTVNDLAAAGATPVLMSLSVIIEEGLPISVLRKVAQSVSEAAGEAKVRVVCGDTKVVERGAADELFLITSGVGVLADGVRPPGPECISEGDVVIISGTLGDHAIAVMSAREGLGFETTVSSDVAPVVELVSAAASAGRVHAMRDPTRGGLAAVLNELAEQAEVGIELDESTIPVRTAVKTACDMLGLDPLAAANEGKMVIIAADDDAQDVLRAVKAARYGTEAAVIGRVRSERPGIVWMRTGIGGSRIVDTPVGEPLPRIC